MYTYIDVYKHGYTCATNPERPLTHKDLSGSFEDIKLTEKHRRRGVTLKCTREAGRRQEKRHATNTPKYARRRVTPVHEGSAREEGGLCINRRSVSLKPASGTATATSRVSQAHGKNKTTNLALTGRKIRRIDIKDRENMVKFTSQIVSGYRSYIHLCIHNDMYSGHLEELFTLRSKVIVR